jgi:hypothetical protein
MLAGVKDVDRKRLEELGRALDALMASGGPAGGSFGIPGPAGPTGPSGSAGGTFEFGDKVVIYDSGGGKIVQRDASQSGVLDAVALVTDGDTIWLPSRSIAMGAGFSLPAGAALIGIDHNSKLVFSGFGGTAITMGEDSICYGFSLTFVGTGDTVIGIDDRAARCRVEDVDVDASGGAVNNYGVYHGTPV